MSPAAKTNARYIIGVVCGIITIVGFAFSFGVGYAQNNADHDMMQEKTADAVVSVKEVEKEQASMVEDVQEIKTDVAVIRTTQKQILDEIKKK